jgi:hypothetical protein
MTPKTINLIDVVALTVDLPEYGLKRGQVGTVVEFLGLLRWSFATLMGVLISRWACAESKLCCYVLSQRFLCWMLWRLD